MREPNLHEFEQCLLRAGVSATNARRASQEIADHLKDLQAEAVANGVPASSAKANALRNIGNLQLIANDMASRPELRGWTGRFPRAASFILPIAYVAMLPTIPLFAGVAKGPQIARWSACLILGALVTAVMFLALQLSIAPI